MPVLRHILPGVAAFALAAPACALADGPTGGGSVGAVAPVPTLVPNTGGTGLGVPAPPPSTPKHPSVPGAEAKIINGIAYAPSYAPIQVRRAIWAGDQIRTKPYIWGGGHGKFKDRGYDCSGSVSYVLHAAGLLKTPEDSTGFFGWGAKGLGRWITVYTASGHAFVQIAGIRLDTSAEGDPHPTKGSGPRWRPLMTSTHGFVPRHAVGF